MQHGPAIDGYEGSSGSPLRRGRMQIRSVSNVRGVGVLVEGLGLEVDALVTAHRDAVRDVADAVVDAQSGEDGGEDGGYGVDNADHLAALFG